MDATGSARGTRGRSAWTDHPSSTTPERLPRDLWITVDDGGSTHRSSTPASRTPTAHSATEAEPRQRLAHRARALIHNRTAPLLRRRILNPSKKGRGTIRHESPSRARPPHRADRARDPHQTRPNHEGDLRSREAARRPRGGEQRHPRAQHEARAGEREARREGRRPRAGGNRPRGRDPLQALLPPTSRVRRVRQGRRHARPGRDRRARRRRRARARGARLHPRPGRQHGDPGAAREHAAHLQRTGHL